LDASNNPFLIGSGTVEAQSKGVVALSKGSSQKSSFLADFTNLLSKTLGAGAGLATSMALPGISGLGLGVASDKLVQSLVKSLGSNTLESAGSSIQVAKQNEFRAPELAATQNLGFLQAASNPYIASQNAFKPTSPSSVSLRV
jgi:hypothetical protein